MHLFKNVFLFLGVTLASPDLGSDWLQLLCDLEKPWTVEKEWVNKMDWIDKLKKVKMNDFSLRSCV